MSSVSDLVLLYAARPSIHRQEIACSPLEEIAWQFALRRTVIQIGCKSFSARWTASVCLAVIVSPFLRIPKAYQDTAAEDICLTRFLQEIPKLGTGTSLAEVNLRQYDRGPGQCWSTGGILTGVNSLAILVR